MWRKLLEINLRAMPQVANASYRTVNITSVVEYNSMSAVIVDSPAITAVVYYDAAGGQVGKGTVVNISSRLRRLFLLPHGATAGELRAAIDRTGSFAADTTYDLCVGTDPPLGSEALLSSLADRLVLLAPSGAGAEASAPPAVQPPTFLDDHGDSGHQGHV